MLPNRENVISRRSKSLTGSGSAPSGSRWAAIRSHACCVSAGLARLRQLGQHLVERRRSRSARPGGPGHAPWPDARPTTSPRPAAAARAGSSRSIRARCQPAGGRTLRHPPVGDQPRRGWSCTRRRSDSSRASNTPIRTDNTAVSWLTATSNAATSDRTSTSVRSFASSTVQTSQTGLEQCQRRTPVRRRTHVHHSMPRAAVVRKTQRARRCRSAEFSLSIVDLVVCGVRGSFRCVDTSGLLVPCIWYKFGAGSGACPVCSPARSPHCCCSPRRPPGSGSAKRWPARRSPCACWPGYSRARSGPRRETPSAPPTSRCATSSNTYLGA